MKNFAELDAKICSCTGALTAKLEGTNGKRAILLCGGTGCLSSNSLDIKAKFDELVAGSGLGDKVTVNTVGCFGFCSQGPFVKILPEDTLYRLVKVEDVEEIFNTDILGGRTVTAYHCPGHTPGEMVFVDDKTHTLLCGDACNCNWLLNTELSTDIRTCVEISLKSLKYILEKCGKEYDADSVFNFHHDFQGFGQALDPNVLPNLIRCMESLLDGTCEFQEIPDALSNEGKTKTAAVYKNVQISCMQGNIADV